MKPYHIKLKSLLEKHPDDIDSTSGVIIEYNDKILVMKKAEGNYSIPKGHIDSTSGVIIER